MATKVEYFSGECRWAKVYKPDEKYGKYSIDVKVDDLPKFKSLGVKASDRDGWVTFRRDPEGKAWKDGKQIIAGKPLVVDAEGKPFDEIIGNGSEVTVKVETYTYDNKFGKGVAMRLESVRVDKHKPYVKEETVAAATVAGGSASSAAPDAASPSSPKPRIPF